MVRAFVSLNTTSRLSLLLVLVLAPTDFSLGQVLQFSPGNDLSTAENFSKGRTLNRMKV